MKHEMGFLFTFSQEKNLLVFPPETDAAKNLFSEEKKKTLQN
jgi:hypothetical protein